MVSPEPLVFSLQHFCLHDGPGIRSLVFFKGCPLRCPWCQNVESWKAGSEIAFKPALCINCGTCVRKCPEHALAEVGTRDTTRCRGCFTCIDSCPSGAMTLFGVQRSPEDVVEELRPEFSLFTTSGGGVTFTGGEPTLYPDFSARLARSLRTEGIHIAMETCGFFDLKRLRPLLRELRLVLFDIKIYDREQHRQMCGADNTVIKKNLKALVEAGSGQGAPAVWPRLPLVPGLTDGQDNIKGWAGFLRSLGISFLTIVPYHPMGASKRRWLGLPAGPELRVPTDAEIQTAGGLFSAEGIMTYKPGEEPFPEDSIGPAQGLPRDLPGAAHDRRVEHRGLPTDGHGPTGLNTPR
ncbi:MAG: glycyl-radical enzyme activating protein [Desulfobacterota bacterium]|nr:glycyl-radical enzyme activating protein [Thermodesulfobacteriota bacterium]